MDRRRINGDGADMNERSGLGLKLIRHLGEMNFNHDDGTEVFIDFKRIN